MKRIQPSVELIREADPFRKIEQIGRTCYKSSSDMTDETARKFYRVLASRSHTAMLEHAWFVFQVSDAVYQECISKKFLNKTSVEGRNLVSGNLRGLNECGVAALLSKLKEMDPMLCYREGAETVSSVFDETVLAVDVETMPEITAEEYRIHSCVTFRFVCDRGVTHEMVRHRPASFAQESTRYCNYAKEKFGSEITVIEPAELENKNPVAYQAWIAGCEAAEKAYFAMMEAGATPQEARAVLPNSLKTEIIMTANGAEWEHFFNLRSRGVTGAPHPDMKKVADMALKLYKEHTEKSALCKGDCRK